MSDRLVVHIPLAEGLACGTGSLCAHWDTKRSLCRKCQRSMRAKLVRQLRKSGFGKGDAEAFADDYLGFKEV